MLRGPLVQPREEAAWRTAGQNASGPVTSMTQEYGEAHRRGSRARWSSTCHMGKVRQLPAYGEGMGKAAPPHLSERVLRDVDDSGGDEGVVWLEREELERPVI